MDIFIPIFIFFTIFVLCSLCGFCCRTKHEGAIFSTPVVITSQTHQPVGAATAYPVRTSPGVVQTGYPAHAPPLMPMPYSDTPTPYPPSGNTTYPGTAPYPPAPYGGQPGGMYPPAASGTYPPQAAPYPAAHQDMNPPSYNEIVNNQPYQKQSPYNPGYTG